MTSKLTLAALALAVAMPTFAVAQTSTGKAQLAEILGVEPEMFTLAQLSELQTAMRTNDTTTVTKILDDAGSSMTAEQLMSGGNGEENLVRADAFYDADYMEGKTQIAANLDLDPNRFTLSQLVALTNAKRDQDADQINKILGDAGVTDVTASDVLQ